MKEKAKPGRRLTARQRALNHRFGKVRAKVEHVFRVVKCQFGYRKVRYRASPRMARRGSRSWHSLNPQDACVCLTTTAAKTATVEGAIFAKDARSEANHRQQHRVDQRFPRLRTLPVAV